MKYDNENEQVTKSPFRAAPFNERELHTILAALRYWQAWMLAHPGLDPDLAEGLTTNPSLTAEEIDELCERLGAFRP